MDSKSFHLTTILYLVTIHFQFLSLVSSLHLN
jgi:hypothetical protein